MNTRIGKNSNMHLGSAKKKSGRQPGCSAGRTVGRGRSQADRISSDLRAASSAWGPLPKFMLKKLRALMERYQFSVSQGDVTLLGDQLYITHAGLLRIAERHRCSGIITHVQKELSDPRTARWVFKATAYKTPGSKGFVGYGDANPSNTSPLVRGAEMRVAETRAVNRALRKAYGIGLCSVEELGSFSAPQKPIASTPHSNSHSRSINSSNGQPKLRDQLCLLIRHHNLDPALVKAYAADFCGTETIKDASRDLVESFIAHISTSAKEDLDGLICKLNSYSRPAEVSQ